MTTSYRQSIQGFEVFGLRNDAVDVTVMPALGAKIVSLIDRRISRQWLWSPPQGARFTQQRAGTPFSESSLVGADELLPTIGPCRWRGLDLVEHGDAWSAAWEMDGQAFEQGRIVTRLRLPISPLWIERGISLASQTLHLDYTLRNLSPEPFEYLWAFHPLLNIAEGDRILLPADCTQGRIDGAFNFPSGARGDVWRWPEPAEFVHLDRLDLGGENRAVKLYTDPLSTGYAAVRNERTGDCLAFQFDVQQIDTLGIWINRGGWNGYHHFALEPTSGAPDRLDVAVNEWKRFGALSAGETRRWELRLTVGAEAEA